MLMMLKALVSIKWFARTNRKISAYTQQAQDQFYAMNIRFPKKSFQYLSSLGSMVNRQETAPRTYPLLIGCGKYDLPMELSAVEMWKKAEPQSRMVIFDDAGHCVNMDVPQKFNEVLQDFGRSTVFSAGIRTRIFFPENIDILLLVSKKPSSVHKWLY